MAMTPQTPQQLAQRFPSKLVSFDCGAGGLTRLRVHTPAASAELYLHGAHLTAWQPAGQGPVLWMSQRSGFEAGKPIRGGVPICLPWFGPHPSDPTAPGHGTFRLQEWELAEVGSHGDAVRLVLRHAWSELDGRHFPGRLDATYTVSIGPELVLELAVTNRDAKPVRLAEALHTYLAVADVRQIRILGLEHTDYLDKTAGGDRKNQGDSPVQITAETDRAYLDTSATCTLEDPAGDSRAAAPAGTDAAPAGTSATTAGASIAATAAAPSRGRRIRVAKSGSATTVVWNPWVAKSAAMPDFGDDEWLGMVCIETANAHDNAVHIAPGATHRMAARIGVGGM